MIGRLVWGLALIAIAAVTSYAQLDRQARYAPELAAGVPEPFRAFAQTHVTAATIRGKDNTLALAEAKRLVERRPIPAEHLTMLAAAQFKAGEIDAATVSIQLAAKRGWRDRQAQEAMLRLALAAGDQAEAARRFAALLHDSGSDDAMLLEIAPLVFDTSDGAGQQAFTDLIVEGARWHTRLLTRGAKVLPINAFREIVEASSSRGARFDCKALQSASSILSARNGQAFQPFNPTIMDGC